MECVIIAIISLLGVIALAIGIRYLQKRLAKTARRKPKSSKPKKIDQILPDIGV
jgi:hypothetical protein